MNHVRHKAQYKRESRSLRPRYPMRLWSFCGPFRPLLWSLCGPNPREHPRNPANIGPAIVGSFAAFRPHSRIFAVLEGNRGERLELAF